MTVQSGTNGSVVLSPRALELLRQLFSPQSNMQLPVSVAEQVVEIRNWLQVNNPQT